ncbi:MAG: electron transport complex subunit RsxC [Oscillospiraceae bacterium]|nr:electron transport complex subunit RsxC [Oscillospiraceae bacterium]
MAPSFFGGVHPRGYKELTCEAPILPLHPKTVSISMSQHIGRPCTPLVKVGDQVTVGQKIGDGEGLCVPVHASVSGKVVAVEARPTPAGTDGMCVVIENDMQDTLCPEIQKRESVASLTAEELTAILREAGITGMGGAGFPTNVKISSGMGKVNTVIVNGAECEPYITSDDRLMRESPERIAGGIRIIQKILQPERTALGIEKNKSKAIAAMRAALPEDMELLELRVRYPQGAEKQLIQTVTGRQVPPGGLPAAVGCAVFNVATCAAIYDAVYDGMPLVRRAVTVTGKAIARPSNFLAPIGTLYSDLVEAAGGFSEEPYKVLCGGPMMGIAQHTLACGTIKGNNALTCLSQADNHEVETPHCIRCGKCLDACPMHLMPLQMHRAQQKEDLITLEKLHVTDCIECGCCAYTCPAGIHLVQSFRTAKKMLRDAQAKEKAKEAVK